MFGQALRSHTSFALAFALSLSLGAVAGCDKGGGDDGKAAEPTESEMAKKAKEAVAEIKAELDKGEDVKYSCAGNLGMFGDLKTSEDEAEKAAFGELAAICYVEVPKKMLADLRDKLAKGELGTTDTVDISVVIESEDFPKDGEAAEIAKDAKHLLEVEIPTHELEAQVAEAVKEKEAGETVSMGCIKAKQIVDASKAALEGDEAGKAALDKFNTTCPAKEE